jgi:hypothetical protein
MESEEDEIKSKQASKKDTTLLIFVNFAFGTPSAALIVKWSTSNIIS